jgi:maltose O-acetyltransferase
MCFLLREYNCTRPHPLDAETRKHTWCLTHNNWRRLLDRWQFGNLSSITIGKGCVIGAGSVVTKDIPDNSLAVGNPAKVIRQQPIIPRRM